MKVVVDNSYFSSVELAGGRLWANRLDDTRLELLEGIQDFSITKSGTKIHIVARDDQGIMWHLHGESGFSSEKIEGEYDYCRGCNLVTDHEGQVHLIYLTDPIQGQGAALRHQTFSGKWTKSMLISSHVMPDKWGFSACWESPGFLHLVYLGHGDGHLFYRAYAAAQKSWSGAVPLVREPCQRPQFFPGTPLSLAWILEENSGQVQLMQKSEYWSQPKTISRQTGHCSGLGFGLMGEKEFAFWRQGEKLWKLDLGQEGNEAVEEDSANYRLEMRVIEDRHGSALAVPVYLLRKPVSEPEVEAPPVQPSPEPSEVASQIQRRDPVEDQLQAAFLEQAFKIQMEWERIRTEYSSVQELITNLEERMKAGHRELSDRIESIPRPTLDPLVQRLERLEVRITKYDREVRGWQSSIESRLGRIEQASLALSRRIGALENPEPEEKRGFLRRILWR